MRRIKESAWREVFKANWMSDSRAKSLLIRSNRLTDEKVSDTQLGYLEYRALKGSHWSRVSVWVSLHAYGRTGKAGCETRVPLCNGLPCTFAKACVSIFVFNRKLKQRTYVVHLNLCTVAAFHIVAPEAKWPETLQRLQEPGYQVYDGHVHKDAFCCEANIDLWR